MGSKPELAGLFLCFCRLEAYCRLSKVQGTPFSHSFLLIPFVAEPKQLPEKWTSYEFHGQDFRLLCYRRWRGKEWRLLQPLFCTGFSVVTCLPSIPPPCSTFHLGNCACHTVGSLYLEARREGEAPSPFPFVRIRSGRSQAEQGGFRVPPPSWNVHPLA